MSPPPYAILFTPEAERALEEMRGQKRYATRLKKITKTLRLLAENPRHPGLSSHRYQSVQGPGGIALWESYIENRTPGAWRIFWIYQPEDSITVISVGPHPD